MIFYSNLLPSTKLFSSDPNCPGPQQGPADGLPRGLDGRGRQNMSRLLPANKKPTVMSKAGRTGNLRQKFVLGA